MTFSKEVESRIRFFQNEYNCIICITEVDGVWDMAVMYPETGKAVTGIKLSPVEENQYKLMIAIRKYFKER